MADADSKNAPMPDDDAEAQQIRRRQLRKDAATAVADCNRRWTDFRTESGTVLEKYFDRTFEYLEGILDDSSRATDWVKDGVALLVGYYQGGRDLCQAVHTLYPSGSRPGNGNGARSSTTAASPTAADPKPGRSRGKG